MDMGVNVLRTNLTNPAKAFLWAVSIPQMLGGGDGTTLATRCQSSSLPGRSTESIHIPFRGTAGFKVPGKLKMGQTWTVEFLESTEDKKTFLGLYAWNQLIQNNKTGTGVPDPSVKTDLYLQCLDQAGAVWLTIKLIGCYIESMPDIALNYDANKAIKFPVTFSYDSWEVVD